MSVAALEAVSLGDCFADLRPGELSAVLSDYHRTAAAIVDQAWSLVVGAVVQLDGVAGTPPHGHALVTAYVRAAQRAAREDVHVALALMRVVNLLAPPRSLMTPRVALRVALATLGRQVVRRPHHQREAPVPA